MMAPSIIETLNARQALGVPRPTGRSALRWFFPVVSSLLLAVVVPLGLVALGTCDLLVARHFHRATVWIAFLLVGVLLPLLGLLLASGAADTLIDALR
jgi:hypothetical protein